MVDFIKVTNAHVKPEVFLNNPNLTFTDRIDSKTGEFIESGRSARFKDMKFFISAKGATGISGSLHKYHNEGNHNHDDFTMENLKSVIEDLNHRFGIDPGTAKLSNIEFGVNLEVPFNPDTFIDHLVTHKYTQFNIEREKTKNYGQVSYNQFIIKIYNKGLQFGLKKNLLRFEVKVVRMAKVSKYDIHTLQDLLIPDKLKLIEKLLLDVFDEILYYDDRIDLESLTQSERELLRDGYNAKFWQDHLRKAGSNASKKFKRYQSLILNHGSSDFQSIRQLISVKWNSLLYGSGNQVRDITVFPEGSNIRDITDSQSLIESDNIRDFTTLSPEPNVNIQVEPNPSLNTSSYNLSIGKNLVMSTVIKKVCPVTGLDISMQKGTSRFLSTTGIKHYLENFPGIFKELRDRLTDTWANEPLDKQISEIAHSIRNSHHSKRIHTQKAIKRLCSTPALFNNIDLVCQQKKNIANQ